MEAGDLVAKVELGALVAKREIHAGAFVALDSLRNWGFDPTTGTVIKQRLNRKNATIMVL
jgi:hypothetical protein